MDLEGSAVTSAATKMAVHEAGLREREHRGLAWQWEKSVANRARLELSMKEHGKLMGDRKDASKRRVAARLAMRCTGSYSSLPLTSFQTPGRDN